MFKEFLTGVLGMAVGWGIAYSIKAWLERRAKRLESAQTPAYPPPFVLFSGSPFGPPSFGPPMPMPFPMPMPAQEEAEQPPLPATPPDHGESPETVRFFVALSRHNLVVLHREGVQHEPTIGCGCLPQVVCRDCGVLIEQGQQRPRPQKHLAAHHSFTGFPAMLVQPEASEIAN